MLPEHLLQYLNEQILCREAQILQLASILHPSCPSPRTIVVHGTTATGKTLTITSILPALDVLHTIVKSRECITARHLLERAVLGVKAVIETKVGCVFQDIDGRCESLGGLAVLLGRMLGDDTLGEQKFILVFDGIDKLRDSNGLPTLLPGLARLGEIIPNLTVVLIMTTPLPRSLHKPGLPHVHFTPYDRTAALKILSQFPMEIFTRSQIEEMTTKRRMETEEDDVWLWNKYVGLVWDSLGRTAARDIISLRALCKKLWEPFVSHIRDGSYGTRDFARLVVRTRDLFRDESALVDDLNLSTRSNMAKDSGDMKRKGAKASQDLSYYTKHLLLAAYLASYNPSRADQTVFTRFYERKKKKAAARKQSMTTNKDGTVVGAAGKHRKISRLLLGPQPFSLERLLAIFHAILPEKPPAGDADILCQVATLANLRMIVKASSSAAGDADGTAKWRVNIGWEYVLQLGKRVGIDMVDFVVE